MHIQLKNIRVSEGLSRESLAFNATLYINGERVGLIANDGNGGETNYEPIDPRGASLIKETVKWCGSFPMKLGSNEDGDKAGEPDPGKFRSHLEEMATCWRNGKAAARFQKKAEKAMMHGVVFGLPGKSYRVMKYKVPIAIIVSTRKGVEQLRRDIHWKVMPLLKADEKILNTNIPLNVICVLDVPEGKWVDQAKVK